MSTVAPITRRVRAYFAPVNRTTSTPTFFDAAQNGRFTLDAPPSPWIDLGWCSSFARTNGGASKGGITPLRAGAPQVAAAQVVSTLDSTLTLEFETWGRLQMALTGGGQTMNLLAANVAPTALSADSTAITLDLGATAAASFNIGDLVAVDADYAAQTGFVGSGVSGAYIQSAAAIGGDANFIRRITLNVGRVASIANGVLTLDAPLLAGSPTTGMQAVKVLGFVDREGGSFFQEWSAVFVMEGEQGDRVIFHYPRLQTMQPPAESIGKLADTFDRIRLSGAFRALAIKDAIDGATVLCYRTYLPTL
jgi:hypothetical protein